MKNINEGIANRINGELKIIQIAIQHKIKTRIIVKILLANPNIYLIIS